MTIHQEAGMPALRLCAGHVRRQVLAGLSRHRVLSIPEGARLEHWRETADLMLDCGIRCITPSSLHYPNRLNDLGSRRPNWLFVKGNVDLLQAQSVAVVGTRNPTWAGEFLTQYSVAVLAEAGLPVVSGLAIGVDSIAYAVLIVFPCSPQGAEASRHALESFLVKVPVATTWEVSAHREPRQLAGRCGLCYARSSSRGPCAKRQYSFWGDAMTQLDELVIVQADQGMRWRGRRGRSKVQSDPDCCDIR